MEHPFDRYAAYTDQKLLHEFSFRPLRKSIRVNTLKTTVEAVKSYGEKKGWKLEQIPWCREGFFIDRIDREEALGKDPLHLAGHFYMQEAASMLPPSLLSPQPGESVLDMSAAPGSKTTQIGSALQGSGVILANDIQEKRLWTLKTAIHRLGVQNVIVTKKVGQWFSKHMTERFDRVLCDAPCTAQGTTRKDADALLYCSLDNIEKMARLQHALLEAAVHSAKVGGVIVYSTCTLTPEENEGVVTSILNKFIDQLEVLHPAEIGFLDDKNYFEQAIADSIKVQQGTSFPFIRLWPQTYDTEGFFCAVLRKTGPTKKVEPLDRVRFEEFELPRSKKKHIEEQMIDMYGDSFMEEHERIFERGEQLILSTSDVAQFMLPVRDYSLGLPFGKRVRDDRTILTHEIATLRGNRALKNIVDVSDEQMQSLLQAKDIEVSSKDSGHVILRNNGICFGLGLLKDGHLKNNLPRWMVIR